MKRHVAAAAIAAVLAVPGAAHAHEAFFARGTEDSAERAFVLRDPSSARAVYVDMPCPTAPFWARVDAEPGDVVLVTLGVPAAGALRGYRPALHLVGPDLPAPWSRPRFDVPRGSVVITPLLDTAAEPRLFHEPLTGTDSWILVEHRLVVVRKASYYIVVEPPAEAGRFWIATGTGERRGAADPTMPERLRSFFDARTAPGLGRSCDERVEEDGVAAIGGGWLCALDRSPPPLSAPGAALVLTLALFARRRRGARRIVTS